MSVYIYLIISAFFFLVAFLLVQVRMIYLNTHPEKYNQSYDGQGLFLDRLFLVIRFFARKVFYLIKVIYRNILHFWVQIIAKFSTFSDKVYMQSRNKFMEEVVKDKKAVPHFWAHLKKYKKEIDEENKNKEV